MSRHTKHTVVLSKVETTAGTDAVPTAAANAILISEVNIDPMESSNSARNLIRGYFGGSEELIGPVNKKLSMTVELQGSGTAATPPAWGALLLGCAMAEAILTTPSRVEYTPISAALKTLTHDVYDDGVFHKLLGSMGNMKLSAKVGSHAKLSFDYTALDGGDTAAANVTPTLTAWKVPVMLAKANVVDITLGCTYSAGVLSGGTVYNSTGLDLDLSNQINFNAMLNNEEVDISGRDVTGSMQLELTSAQEVALLASIKANTLQSVGFTIGTATGYKIIIFCPAVQFTKPKKQELNGKRLIGYTLGCKPSSGNDELRIVQV